MPQTFVFWYTLIIFMVMVYFLIREIIEAEIVIFSALLLLLLGRVINVKETFVGFSNEGMLTVASLFVVAGAQRNLPQSGRKYPRICD